MANRPPPSKALNCNVGYQRKMAGFCATDCFDDDWHKTLLPEMLPDMQTKMPPGTRANFFTVGEQPLRVPLVDQAVINVMKAYGVPVPADHTGR